jgi:hypothetical protein
VGARGRRSVTPQAAGAAGSGLLGQKIVADMCHEAHSDQSEFALIRRQLTLT